MAGAAERQYDFWARWYDRIWRRYSKRTSAELLDWANVEPGTAVLDVGCGTGAIAHALLERDAGFRIVGVDVSEKMLNRARHRLAGRGVQFVRARAESLPFSDGAFDVVLSASAFHYFPDPLAACLELHRVLKNGGRLYLTDWSRAVPVMRLRDAMLRRIDPAHVRMYTIDEVAAILTKAGFQVVRTSRYRAGLYWMMLVEAAVER